MLQTAHIILSLKLRKPPAKLNALSMISLIAHLVQPGEILYSTHRNTLGVDRNIWVLSSLPHPTGAEKGVEVQRTLLFLHCYIIAPCLCRVPPAFSMIKPIVGWETETRKRYATCSRLRSKPMAEVGGEPTGPDRAAAEALQGFTFLPFFAHTF